MKISTNKEDYVSLKIFESKQPLDEAAQELLDLYRAQRNAAEYWRQEMIQPLHKIIYKRIRYHIEKFFRPKEAQ